MINLGVVLWRSFCSTANRYCSRKMRVAVVRCLDTEETLTLSFTYGQAANGIRDRKYNFERRRDEPLERAKLRIVSSIGRELEKKAKKLKRKKGSTTDQPDIPPAIPETVIVAVCRGADALDDTVSCQLALADGNSLEIGDHTYTVVVNPPQIRSMSLPANIMAGFAVYPRYEVEFVEKTSCRFTWFSSTNVVLPVQSSRTSAATSNPEENSTPLDGAAAESVKSTTVVPLHAVKDWQRVGEGYCYVPSVADIGRKLKVSGTPHLTDGFDRQCDSFEVDSTVAVSAGPGPCPFDNRHKFTASSTGSQSFRFVTYNILADLYADSDFSRDSLFPYCPPYALNIDYRKQLLLKEIKGYNSDVICLQEVDAKVFKHDLQPAMIAEGLDGYFNLKGGKVAEGLACFYRTTKFKLVEAHNIILADEFQSSPALKIYMDVIEKNAALKERILSRTTALQVVQLESLEQANKQICIANTHLYSRPDADHIRLLQAGACVAHLEQVVNLARAKNPESEVSVILCGDFNSTPESGVYQFVTTQFIPNDHFAWKSNEAQAVTDFSPSHSLQLESACGTPDYTNFTVGFVGCLDYIFSDCVNLRVEKVVPLPSDQEVRQHTAIPSITMPSDHIALACDLKWIKAA